MDNLNKAFSRFKLSASERKCKKNIQPAMVNICTYMHTHIYTHIYRKSKHRHTHMHVYTYVCMGVCIYTHVCIK